MFGLTTIVDTPSAAREEAVSGDVGSIALLPDPVRERVELSSVDKRTLVDALPEEVLRVHAYIGAHEWVLDQGAWRRRTHSPVQGWGVTDVDSGRLRINGELDRADGNRRCANADRHDVGQPRGACYGRSAATQAFEPEGGKGQQRGEHDHDKT